ncbi:dTDP-glucose 4,6-dehydratase [Micromonospora sp. KC207]|uniref:dTDP-glucose 4,6-dehydratase n=1 Tax=Micromonospora sp. KC207 TaxID=2530377 RepID=UPI00104EAA49|nr:dTDP-glucose 4,6-dehydratase [Micromonospora sp. KC207]TDC61255.1 dTDP-glucose 4,6-dehydratase [Micromonospora sp. KC207]
MEHLLVTGGAGFIGANFVRRALAARPGLRLTVLDALTYAGNRASLAEVADRITFVRGDVRDVDLVDALVQDCDTVVHFAAESHVDNSLQDPTPFLRTNVEGTFVLLEAVRRHDRRLHHVSTDEVFGSLPLHGGGAFTEETRYDPSSPYSATKAASDLLVRAWARSYGLRATLSNCANNYGPYQNVEKFLPRQITNVLRGQRPKLYGTGANVREWTHVDDHNDAVLLILDAGAPGETYLIGSGAQWSNRALLELTLTLLGRPADDFDRVPDRPAHDLRYACDSSRIRRELGWRPRHPDLAEGLVVTIDWYRHNEWWWGPQKAATEARYAAIGR